MATPRSTRIGLQRLQLAANANIHGALTRFSRQLSAVINEANETGGGLDASDVSPVLAQIDPLWNDLMDRIEEVLNNSILAGAEIGFAQLSTYHNAYVRRPLNENIQVQAQRSAFEIMNAHRDRIVIAHRERDYAGVNLSERIWRLNTAGRQGLENQVRALLTANNDPRDVIESLEAYLGHNQDCPRWTRERLDRSTPIERLRSSKGLLNGTPCSGRGFSYNATRLARTEITNISSMALLDTIGAMPWVEMVRWELSPLHPPIACVCEDHAAGGVDGRGLYPKEEVPQPGADSHPHCMCQLVPQLPPPREYASEVRDWAGLRTPNPGLDAYTNYVGQERDTLGLISLGFLTLTLDKWLEESGAELLGAL